MSTEALPLLIAGAGIGGLAFAIRCRQHGIAVRLLEGRDAPTTDGAGIQLGPNATRILQDLSVAEALAPHVCTPDAIIVGLGATGRVLQRLPLSDWIRERHDAPYWVMHRADLHSALLDTLRTDHNTHPEFGWRVATAEPRASGVSATSEDGDIAAGCGLIAADGLWSHLRKRIVRADHPIPYSGKAAARTVIARDAAPEQMAGNHVGVWFSPHGHLVHYPVQAGRAVAVVAVTPREASTRGWGEEQSAAAMARDLGRIAPALDTAFARTAHWRMWSLFDPEPFPRVHDARICLLGDAAHPVLPFLAQGGGLAIEDAVVLADQIAQRGTALKDLEAAFAAYASARAARWARVQATSRRNGQIYQLGGPMALARDLTLQAIGGRKVMAGYDWLYGWRNAGLTPARP
jgi:salicylate hydroxylase